MGVCKVRYGMGGRTHLRPMQFLGPKLKACNAPITLPPSPYLASVSGLSKKRSGLNFQGSTQLFGSWLMEYC